jgi:large subunit ribosomal protein LP0
VLYVLLQNDVHILKEGDKVGASDATLLNMLNISPFSYGLLVQMVYDSGTIFEPAILDIKPDDLRVKFAEVLSFFPSFLTAVKVCYKGNSQHMKN